jgi:hypothetical protein
LKECYSISQAGAGEMSDRMSCIPCPREPRRQ